MVLKITEELSDRVNRIVRHSCCNCIDGNCLLLDDGEEHSCVQLISKYGIYCNYLLK
ncbi:cysteine-rich VLP protein, partial [Ruminococcus difficilis]